MTFVRRRIDLTFRLGQGAFGEEGFDTIEFKGLRAQVEIHVAGGVSMATCDLRVYGMGIDAMNKLTVLRSSRTASRRNGLVVSVGDDATGVAAAFTGDIVEAWVDMHGAPEVVFVVSAMSGFGAAMKSVPPTTHRGSVDAATVVAGIAAQMSPVGAVADSEGNIVKGLNFQNDGVSVQISNPYLPGTALDQLQSIARAGDFKYLIDNDTLIIWPKNGVRKGLIPLISAATGMVGYPSYTQDGIELTTLYNPSIYFGGIVEVDTELEPAKGRWQVFNVIHELDAEVPGGRWFTYIHCNIFGTEASIATR